MPMSPHLGVATGKALAPWCLLSAAMFSLQSQRRVRIMACRRHGSRRHLYRARIVGSGREKEAEPGVRAHPGT